MGVRLEMRTSISLGVLSPFSLLPGVQRGNCVKSTSGVAAAASSTPKAPGKGLSGGGELGRGVI